MKEPDQNKLVPYDPAKIEPKWQKKWARSKLYKTQEEGKKKKEKFYILDMFPYPSGEGLHVGHPKGYIATDVISRMKRMQGKNVLHPMGFDAFGLPAENYAIKTKTNPEIAVAKNVARYKEQLALLGFDYDWSREVNTTDPAYYRWTQWIFLQMWKKGLAFESYEPVNWCPTDKTVLANEDVENGRCERCGTPVEKKALRQWVLKITDYADRLLEDLDATQGIPLVTRTEGEDGVKEGLPFVERWPVVCIIKHWVEDKYLCVKWKASGWQGFIIGGIEDGETVAEAGIREIREETGFKNIRFVREVGKVDTKFYQMVKGVNRHAHFTGAYFELTSGECEETSQEEKDLQDIVWLTKKEVRDFTTHEDMTYLWDLFAGKKKQEIKPLLDWPQSIKEAQRNWIGRSEGAEVDFRLVLNKGKPRFVLIHGYKGSPDDDFFPWLKAELERRGHEVETPELPDADHPKESEQVEYVLENCQLDEDTVVVAHSLGSIVALKALMKLNKSISGLVLVAPAVDPRFDTHYDSRPFSKDFKWDFDYEQIKHLTSGRIVVLSDLTEKFRAPYLKHLAHELDARLVETVAKDEHFCADQEPEILKAVTPSITVFTTRPDTIFGVTYVVLAPEHPWIKELLPRLENKTEVEAYIATTARETEIERTDTKREKTGVELKGIKAINTANGEEVPVWIADYVLADYGTGAVMAVPAHDERDWEFAEKFKLPLKYVIAPYFLDETEACRPREGKDLIHRTIAVAIVRHWSEDKYLLLEWKKNKWKTFVTGGIEKGESYEDGGRREIYEETGYKNIRFVRDLGGPNISYFFAPHKDTNQIVEGRGMYFELVDSAQDQTSETEKSLHDLVWVEKEKVADFIASASGSGDQRYLQLYWDRFQRGKFTWIQEGQLIDSGAFTGKDSASVKKDITASVGGRWVTRYKLRDWVFSRQRYWGEPIPLIRCEKCGIVPVPEKDLPVKLPKVESYEPTGTGESPLAAITKWVNVKCPKCKGPAKRETNTMPQWAGSCWYYLRYEDPKNKKALVDRTKEKYWSPVDLYVGGAEHATRHLIYARFWHKFLYDIGAVSRLEPFEKLQSVGLIMGEDGRKMSKRFGNVVNPDDIVKTFGADTLRVYEMFMGPFDQAIPWSTDSIVGSRRFIERVWKLKEKVGKVSENAQSEGLKFAQRPLIGGIIHRTIRKVTDDIENMRFNTAISALMIALNELEKTESIDKVIFEWFLKLLAPFAPHVTEELWISLGNKESVHVSDWPVYDPSQAVEAETTIVVQVNGKTRGSFTVASGATDEELKTAALALPETKKWLEGKIVKKVIIVRGKLVSIVSD